MSGKEKELSKTDLAAVAGEQDLKSLVELLSGSSRRARQSAAQTLATLAKNDAEKLAPFGSEFVDALNRPEAQTRWECLDVLTGLVDFVPAVCAKAIDGAEASLFDEESGPVRLAAMRFLCKIGATSKARSDKTWPFIDEGIQCYHGDLEFSDMLIAVAEYAKGHLSDSVKQQLADRMRFDAENSRGALKRRAIAIIESVS